MKTLISSAPADNARWNIKKGDVLNQLHGFDDNTFDGLMTDPPYGLRFMEHKWDARVPTVDVWKETLRVCKPGAFLLAFGGTRTFHRLGVEHRGRRMGNPRLPYVALRSGLP